MQKQVVASLPLRLSSLITLALGFSMEGGTQEAENSTFQIHSVSLKK